MSDQAVSVRGELELQEPERLDLSPPVSSDAAGHPAGFWFFLWGGFAARSSYYGMRAILPLYMTQRLLIPDDRAAEWYSYFKPPATCCRSSTAGSASGPPDAPILPTMPWTRSFGARPIGVLRTGRGPGRHEQRSSGKSPAELRGADGRLMEGTRSWAEGDNRSEADEAFSMKAVPAERAGGNPGGSFGVVGPTRARVRLRLGTLQAVPGHWYYAHRWNPRFSPSPL